MTPGGGSYEMPPPLSYRLTWTGGVPCDELEVTVPWDGELLELLPRAYRFAAYEGERLLLRGVVDEIRAETDRSGETMTLWGRGMLALLLDNEAEAAFYQRATVEELVRSHVAPWGVDWRIDRRPQSGESYQVTAGSSQWRAVSDFTRYAGDFVPYITPEGVLVIGDMWAGGRQLALERGKILSCLRWERRYGVVSQVLVRDKTRGVSQVVVNREFTDRGGSARRVVYTPGRSTWSAMRYTGEYQISQSAEDAAGVELLVAGRTELRPGDRTSLELPRLGVAGTYRVAAVEESLDQGGLTTGLTLWAVR